VRTAITELYQQQGYITSGAYIPPQKLQGGVVKIQVIEGTLAEIQVTGTRRLNPNYIRSRIARGASQRLNHQSLLETLQLLQLNPLIENISAELSAGTRLGESLLSVKVTEADTTNVTVALDNGRSPSVGTFRRRLQFDEANLLGQGDGLSLAYINTDGSQLHLAPQSPKRYSGLQLCYFLRRCDRTAV
jgi:hemolysin activation/secretion protein